MYKITNNYIDIDPHTYLHSTNNHRTRNTHNQTYQTYYANTDSYKHSYFPRTIRDWNRLPQSILNSNTIDSFTKQIHMHLSPQHPNTNTYTWFTSLPCTLASPIPHQPTQYMRVMHPRGCPTHYHPDPDPDPSLPPPVHLLGSYSSSIASFLPPLIGSLTNSSLPDSTIPSVGVLSGLLNIFLSPNFSSKYCLTHASHYLFFPFPPINNSLTNCPSPDKTIKEYRS